MGGRFLPVGRSVADRGLRGTASWSKDTVKLQRTAPGWAGLVRLADGGNEELDDYYGTKDLGDRRAGHEPWPGAGGFGVNGSMLPKSLRSCGPGERSSALAGLSGSGKARCSGMVPWAGARIGRSWGEVRGVNVKG